MRNPRYLYVLEPNSTVETECETVDVNSLAGHDHKTTDSVHGERQPALQIEAGASTYVVPEDSVIDIIDLAEQATNHRTAPINQ
jgi:hypothetical protein